MHTGKFDYECITVITLLNRAHSCRGHPELSTASILRYRALPFEEHDAWVIGHSNQSLWHPRLTYEATHSDVHCV